MNLTAVFPSDTHRALRQNRPWLLILLLGALLFAQTTLAWHKHDAISSIDSDCEICLQLSSGSTAALSKPELPQLNAVSLQVPGSRALNDSFFTPTPHSRGPPSH